MITDSNDIEQTIDNEIDAQIHKTGTEGKNDDIVDDDLGDDSTSTSSDGGDKDKEPDPIKTPPGTFPLCTMLCGFHMTAMKMATKKVNNLTLQDFAYPDDLKPALEEALMKVVPNIVTNPYFIIGGILFMHSQNMIALAKQREDEKIPVTPSTPV